ncbi:acyl-homoserine-lactone synthase [Aidingimonas halophila]|uniref:Acyl-homoserine-lactone synthase n=1 Tax=Aidingimonas halophila TaxID=574349 RepID=A0A1H3A0K8_9GAMM|nr:N-acyl-L-homoserine lactone synthetase [Aidingimonas halophila]
MAIGTETAQLPCSSHGDVTAVTLDRHGYRLEFPLRGRRLAQAFELRAKVFCGELGWVGHPGQLQEVDVFDASVWHLGVLAQSQLAAYLRVHPYGAPWMISSVFADVVPPDCVLRCPGACEVSRLVVAPAFRRTVFSDGQTAAGLVCQLLYALCVLNQIDTVHMIVTLRALRALKLQGLPCRSWLHHSCQCDRDAPVFATLNWEEFRSSTESLIAKRRPAFLATAEQARFAIVESGPC